MFRTITSTNSHYFDAVTRYLGYALLLLAGTSSRCICDKACLEKLAGNTGNKGYTNDNWESENGGGDVE